MDKLIKQTDVINEIEDAFSMGETYCDKFSLIGRISVLPSISNKGKWIYREGKTIITKLGIDFIPAEYKCSCCGYSEYTHFPNGLKLYNYCPNCGAEMNNE